MRNLISGARFRRDVKLAKRRGKDMSKLRELILLLADELRRMTGNGKWQVPGRQARGFLELPGASFGGAILREVFVELLI